MKLRLFLSSTLEDLREARSGIARLLSVIPVDLIQMELFGSDESQPIDYALQRVRESQIFVGVYAERYGTLDPKNGLSITELEYREAAQLLKQGALAGLLVYILDSKAAWPVHLVDRDPEQVARLVSFKQTLKANHLVTFFKDPDDLALWVLRDVLRKLGVGTATAFTPRPTELPPSNTTPQILGMEFYTERDAGHFRGREQAIAATIDLVSVNPVSLLVGDSGIGKTSLVQAGLFPTLKGRGWSVASCRPLNDPDRNIAASVWAQLLSNPASSSSSVIETVGIISSACSPHPVLIVVDQFEDAIPYLSTDRVSGLLNMLARVHVGAFPNVHVLLCYRGDADPKVGPYWQTISGSPTGLPRHYLTPLTLEVGRSIVSELLASRMTADRAELANRLADDLTQESKALNERGIYPPFLQMVVETLVRSAEGEGAAITLERYQSLGSTEIIGRYLVNQLRFLADDEERGRAILQALVSKAGRLRKSVDELAQHIGIGSGDVQSVLAKMASLRLVRGTQDGWEIVHDYLAQKISEELVDPEERESRVYRDVLIAKAAARARTGELLTPAEQVGVYYHRRRIRASLEEMSLLFVSSLHGNGPTWYYVGSAPEGTMRQWTEEALKSPDEATRLNAHRLWLERFGSVPLDELATVLHEYKLQSELAQAVSRLATSADLSVLIKLRTRRGEVIAKAARETIYSVAPSDSTALLTRLLRARRTEDWGLACRIMTNTQREDRLAVFIDRLRNRSILERAKAACAMAQFGPRDSAAAIEQQFDRKGKTAAFVYGFALGHLAQRTKDVLFLSRLLDSEERSVEGTLASIAGDRGGLPLDRLLKLAERFDVSDAVLRSVQTHDRSALRDFLSPVPWNQDLRDFVVALLRVGDGSDAEFVLDKVAGQDEPIEFWHLPLLEEAFARAIDGRLKSRLERLVGDEVFWRYHGDTRGTAFEVVNCEKNVYMYKRLVGVGLIQLSSAADWPLLKRLLFHEYWTIRIAAARKVASFAGEPHLDAALEELRSRIAAGDSRAVDAVTLVDAAVYALPKATRAVDSKL